MIRRKRRFSWYKFWQLRYRMYALLVIFIIIPVLYASSSNIPQSIEAIGYEVVDSNILAEKIQKKKHITVNLPKTEVSVSTDKPKEDMIYIDKTGKNITDALKKAGYNLGFIYSQPLVELGQIPPSLQKKELVKKTEAPKEKTLDDIIVKPTSAQRTNFLTYPKYKINAPIIYSSMEDLFEPNKDPGCKPDTDAFQCKIDPTKPRDTSDVNSPLQRKLQEGVLHLAFTPPCGEVGNCYIVGHSSNYAYIKSNYNSIFKPIEQKSQPGEEFTIYDRYGRELKFRVFESLKIEENNIEEAYKNFPGERIVTLQTSIVTYRQSKGLYPYERWLTRAKLIE